MGLDLGPRSASRLMAGAPVLLTRPRSQRQGAIRLPWFDLAVATETVPEPSGSFNVAIEGLLRKNDSLAARRMIDGNESALAFTCGSSMADMSWRRR